MKIYTKQKFIVRNIFNTKYLQFTVDLLISIIILYYYTFCSLKCRLSPVGTMTLT